jgi:hypothetical protein
MLFGGLPDSKILPFPMRIEINENFERTDLNGKS